MRRSRIEMRRRAPTAAITQFVAGNRHDGVVRGVDDREAHPGEGEHPLELADSRIAPSCFEPGDRGLPDAERLGEFALAVVRSATYAQDQTGDVEPISSEPLPVVRDLVRHCRLLRSPVDGELRGGASS